MRDVVVAVAVVLIAACAAGEARTSRVAGRRPSPGAAQPAATPPGASSPAPASVAAESDAQAASPTTPSMREVYRHARGVGGRQFVEFPVEGQPAQ